MMRKNSKLLALAVICLFTLAILAGCGGGEKGAAKKDDKYPSKPINVIVSYAAGGGTDVGARILLPYVEKELGVPLNVINKPGGGGWVGWTDLLKADPDGYTIGYINTPNLMTGYLDPQYKRDKTIDDFAVIANHVLDYGAIAINPKETRFKDLKELLEYAKKNEVTATTTGVGSDDHIAILKINKALGTKFVPVHTKGAAEGKASVMGGHVDTYFANVGEVLAPHKSGELKTIGVMAPERSEFFPDIPTLKEAGADVTSWSGRGLAAPKGIDPAKLEKLVAAFEKAMKNEEHIQKMKDMGLAPKFMKGEEYVKFLKDDEKGVIEVSDLLGWKK
ncbi:tripartite tricarboxylate transporter substrate binding protein [Thermanaerosceptrum fracticalcis]|jgi:tripartite-type tricarboxylate transporter receptor subunit TctC|uniref:Tripartite tricarboxylate transporter substrate binding protein n=1 Tax=Thermanaerosceptrum fracticalcis TaxID=1712410 RepID=A0A7G6E7K6_THEFR|nr:tripartite tricarboxylate transporter substrate binding protein [Thermanaerosceptrum fracticalcis]QNB48060.1 tripartite tricarboxylate transporter substrate binding protein [Thermanaerosceptrum fracticalcis]